MQGIGNVRDGAGDRPHVLTRLHGAVERMHRSVAEEVNRGHEHMLLGVISNVAQTILLVGVFYLMSVLSGFGTAMIRGDLLIYLITGVFLFNLHVKSVTAILGSDRGSKKKELPRAERVMATVGAAVGCLYTQLYSVAIVLGLYYAFVEHISIHRPYGVVVMLVLSWISGVGVGLILIGLKQRVAGLASFLAQAYSRINMIGSGQMFVANMLPANVLVYFEWNPLFHIIDQARGFAFLNYSPWFSNLAYPALATAVLLLIGLLAEAATRK
jgi:ABC-type polysaccharide/polyol phosphate export permease